MIPDFVHQDPWLSELLSSNAYSIDVEKLTLEEWGTQTVAGTSPFQRFIDSVSSPLFCYTKVGTEEQETIGLLESLGFRLIDTNITLTKAIRNSQSSLVSRGEVGFVDPTEEDQVDRLARSAFQYSRFHLDPIIPNQRANSIKAAWAQNFFRGARGDGMIVSRENGVITGFLQFLQRNDRLIIDLIAVGQQYRNKGYAQKMIRFLEYVEPTSVELIVGTQIANVPSIRLYEGLGFKFSSAKYVLHLHRRD